MAKTKEQLEKEIRALNAENKKLKQLLRNSDSQAGHSKEAAPLKNDLEAIEKREKFEEIRRRAEEILARKDAGVPKQTGIDIQQALQELEINQIELELQNEELLNTQKTLIKTSERFEQLYNEAPVGYFIIDRTGTVFSPNNTLCSLLGYNKKALTGTSFANLIYQEDRQQIFEFFKRLFPSTKKEAVEARFIKQDGRLIHMYIEGVRSFSGSHHTNDFFITTLELSQLKKTEKSLNESYEKLNLALSAANLAYWDWNFEIGIITLSKQRNKSMYISANQLEHTFDDWVQSIHPDDRSAFKKAVELLTQPGNETFELRYRIKYYGSGYHWIWDKGSIVERNEFAEPKRISGISIDITDQVYIEQELNRFKRTLDNTLDAVFMFNQNSLRFFYANNGAFALSGYSLPEIRYKTPLSLFPDFSEIEFKSLLATLKEGNPPLIRFETMLTTENGTKKHVGLLLQYLPSADEGGRYILLMRDITAEKAEKEKLEKAYDALEEKVRLRTVKLQELNNSLKKEIEERKIAEEKISFQTLLLDQVENAVIFTGLDDKIKYWNRGAEHIYGWKSQEVIGKLIYEVTVPTPLVHDGEIIMRTLKEEGRWTGNFQVRHKNGTLFTASISLSIIKDRLGKIIGTVGISQDISDLEKSQKELKQAKKIAEAANRVKSDFLANVSHELRTPLNGVLGFTQVMLRDENLSDKQEENLHIIERSGRHLLNLINDILDFSQIEANIKKPHYADFNLTSLLNGIASLISAKAAAQSLQFKFVPDKTLPAFFYGDEKMIHQILINLLDNAVKFTKKGSVTLSTKNLDGKKIRFEVQDTGIGIKPDMLKTIFLPFRQSFDAYSKSAGTGLGLSISKRLIELMDSTLCVESNYEKGSRFWFDLHLLQTNKNQETKIDSNKINGIQGTPPNLVILDNNEESNKLLQGVMSNLGFFVTILNNYIEPGELLKIYKPDILLINVNSLKQKGLDFLSGLRSLSEYRQPKIIATSDEISNALHLKKKSGEIDAVIRKPFEIIQLLEVFHSLLNIDWEYKQLPDEKKKVQGITPIEDADVPAKETLQKFLNHTTIGDIRGIHKLIDELSLKNANFKTFVDHIKFLAQNYEMEQIHKVIKDLMEKNR